MTQVLDIGPVEDRAALVVTALRSNEGYHLMQSPEFGPHLVKDAEFICIVPRDVMEFLIERDEIEFLSSS